MTSEPIGIEDFPVIDGTMSQGILFTILNITLSIVHEDTNGEFI